MLKPVIYLAALVVFGICLYAFLSASEVFDGKFKSDPLAWYFLAKGIFCALSLCLSYWLLEAVRQLRR
jgi:hypothetical protein